MMNAMFAALALASYGAAVGTLVSADGGFVESTVQTPLLNGIDIDQAPLVIAAEIRRFIEGKNYLGAAVIALFAIVASFRRWVLPRLPAGKVKDWFATKWGGWVLNFSLSLTGGLASLAYLGFTISSVISVIVGAAIVSLTAAGVVALTGDVKKARDAGTQAASAPTDTLNS